MGIQIDLWAGELHQRLASTVMTDDWVEASRVIQEAVEAGLLANVIHTDFVAPRHKQEVVLKEIIKEALK